MIGVGLIVIAVVLLIYSLTMPKVASVDDIESLSYSSETSGTMTVSSIETSKESEEKTSLKSDCNQNADTTKAYSEKALSSEENSSSTSATPTFPINLNTCTVNDLLSIDSVGEARAQAIIEYREYLGSYTSVEQLKDIKGIGDSIYAKIEPYVTV